MKAKYRGREYDIPDMWWVGFTQSNPDLTPLQIVRWWAWQIYASETGEVPDDNF